MIVSKKADNNEGAIRGESQYEELLVFSLALEMSDSSWTSSKMKIIIDSRKSYMVVMLEGRR